MNYQPILDLSNNSAIGFEALVRWDHPDRGLLMPSDFLPLALESNLLPDLEWEIILSVISLLEEHKSRFKETGIEWISVNLSRQYFFQSDSVQQILDELDRRNVSPSFLNIELSEKAAVKKEEVTQDNLMKLKRAGYRSPWMISEPVIPRSDTCSPSQLTC